MAGRRQQAFNEQFTQATMAFSESLAVQPLNAAAITIAYDGLRDAVNKGIEAKQLGSYEALEYMARYAGHAVTAAAAAGNHELAANFVTRKETFTTSAEMVKDKTVKQQDPTPTEAKPMSGGKGN